MNWHGCGPRHAGEWNGALHTGAVVRINLITQRRNEIVASPTKQRPTAARAPSVIVNTAQTIGVI